MSLMLAALGGMLVVVVTGFSACAAAVREAVGRLEREDMTVFD